MKATHYIVYDENENFIDMGTSEELQERFNMTKLQIRQKATDTKRRIPNSGVRRGLLFYSVGKMEV